MLESINRLLHSRLAGAVRRTRHSTAPLGSTAEPQGSTGTTTAVRTATVTVTGSSSSSSRNAGCVVTRIIRRDGVHRC